VTRDGTAGVERRGFLARVLMGAGLALSYGLFGAYAIAYLFPPRARARAQRLFVGRRADFAAGSARPFIDQKGRTLLILASDTGLEAFDTRCPHLGCKVHWEPEHARFFCPCHNGVFDRAGVATGGPPADAGQSLTRVPLDVDLASGNVFLRGEEA
jgi:Rieske Fe-S protein